ncbi:hypothetical protein KR200_001443, partial [Drosophila serrata]
LVIFMYFIALSLQKTSVTTLGTPSVKKAVSPKETSFKIATKAPRNKPQSLNGAAGSYPAGGSLCQPHELLSENGCIERDVFPNRVITRSRKNEGFDKGMEPIGVMDVSNCKAEEVKTPFGCEKAMSQKTRNELRVPVQHSTLKVEHVMDLNYRRGFVHSDAEGKQKVYKPKATSKDPPINAHNRPRKDYIQPGRRLRTGRHCRPYEVLSRGGKCVRKKGKKGVYEHKNHVYGLQPRHRHPSSK